MIEAFGRANQYTMDKTGPDNVRPYCQYGNGKSYLLARLDRDHPELAARVRNGELSARAAGIEAGFVKKTVTVEDSVEGAVRWIGKRFSVDEIDDIYQALLGPICEGE